MPLGILSMLAVLVGILSVLLALEPNDDPNKQQQESSPSLFQGLVHLARILHGAL